MINWIKTERDQDMDNGLLTKKILSYIENCLAQGLTPENMPADLHYSKFYLARVFRQDTGLTLYRYIRGRRLDEGAKKLAWTDRPIVEIALEAGYGSQQAFTQAFRPVYGCTPQEYRRRGIFIPMQRPVRIQSHDQQTPVSSAVRGGELAA